MVPIIRTCSLAAALLLAAPAAAQADLGDYVRARAADAEGASAQALQGYARALAAAPGDEVVALRAYREALVAGDYGLAGRAAAVLEKSGTAPPDAALIAFTTALQSGDAAGAQAALARLHKGPFDFITPVLAAWLAQDRGENGLALLDGEKGSALSRHYIARQRVLLAIAAGRSDDAILALLPEALADSSNEDARIDIARLLGGARGQALLRRGSPELVAIGHSLGAPRRADARYGVSRLLLMLAADLANDQLPDLSISLSRAVLLLDPQEDRARLYLARALDREGATSLSLATLDAISPDSPYGRRAAAARLGVLTDAGRIDAAIAAARALAEGPGATRGDLQNYGDLLLQTRQFEAAAKLYASAIADGGAEDWQLHFQRGMALDRAGQWQAARTELDRAVQLAPDQVEPLRYLGVALFEHAADKAEAIRLLERARVLKPDDAGVADALGWAYFQQGEVMRAVPLLEKAVQGDPGGSVANEHLGDAYWQVGRRYEARYAWRAAAIYADPDAAGRIARKLAEGLTGTS